MKLIAGLGNPGPEYAWTRHNAGWIMLDTFTARLGLSAPRLQFEGAFWVASIFEDERVAWLKPYTYMNLSGKSVAAAAAYFNIEPEDVLILMDDVSIPFGTVRYRDGGSAGGQNGLKSIIGALGTADVPRLRAGVGGPAPGREMKDWVLSRFSKSEIADWPKICDVAWKMLIKWVRGEAGEGITERLAVEKSEPHNGDDI